MTTAIAPKPGIGTQRHMDLTEISGQIERITYSNEENGYTVARVKVHGQRDLVTVVGTIMSPAPGEILHMRGKWTSHPSFGWQFNIVEYQTKVPATSYGIQKYLGSGLIKGIGPVMAKRMVKRFGEEILDIIENTPERLMEISGIGKKRVAMIQSAWEDQKQIRSVMLFLQSHGVSSGYAAKIFKQYGQQAISVVQENPYRLAMDIFGIGFVTADRIAGQLGFPKDSPVRLLAGISYVLHQLSNDGHVYYPYEALLEKCMEMLEVDRESIAQAVAAAGRENTIVIEDMNTGLEEYRPNNKAVYLSKYYTCEVAISKRLRQLHLQEKSIRKVDTQKALSWVQEKLAITLAPRQQDAIAGALDNKVLVITGGPGTGKTTIIHAVLKIFTRITPDILLAAPTGRAAKRMSEATGHRAVTIHRLLEFSPAAGGFQRNGDNPLGCDLLVIDEASMIDTILMHHLLKAVPAGATLILVGDVNQLPSVGAGNVLNDIITSGIFPVVTLHEIFRQARQSRIVVNAHSINRGVVPPREEPDAESDFYFIEQEEPERALEVILSLVKDRIPSRFGQNPFEDIQVLTPMHKGIVGAGNLNTELQKTLNPGNPEVTRGAAGYRSGDKVMQIRNNYDKEVFNGDIGTIRHVNREAQEVVITFDLRDVVYDYSDLDEIMLAYAVSVHKAQGSEYPVVVMPVLMQHYVLLQRNLIYTAVTRGKKLVVLVGTRKAYAIGIKNDKTLKRFTRLGERLVW